jgi:hypothetical protein
MIDTTQRFLGSQDDDLLAKILGDRHQFMPLLNRVKAAYLALEIGEFTSETWEQLKSEGAYFAEARYNQMLNDEIAAAGVKHRVLKRVVLEGTDEYITDLKRAFNDLTAFQPSNYSQRTEKLQYVDISYDGEDFVVSESDKETIADKYCRVYINPGVEAELYQSLQALLEARDNYKVIADKLGIGWGIKRGFGALDRFFDWREGEPTIIPSTVVYGTTIAKRMEAQGSGACMW